MQVGRNDIQLSGRQLELGGRTVTIGARAFDVLNLLMKNRERVVTKKELLETAWPGLVVEENNLQVQISTLRKVLGHNSITTIPGQGYQFTAPLPAEPDPFKNTGSPEGAAVAVAVETDPLPETEAPAELAPPTSTADAAPSAAPALWPLRKSWLIAALVVVLALGLGAWRYSGTRPLVESVAGGAAKAAVAVDRSVAVLPFVDMSEKKDLEYFSDGLCEEVLHLLSRVPEMRVAARTSAFSFRGKSVDVPTIAHTLQVANVLEGSVRRSGDQLRITAQLVRADNGYELWSQTYDRKLGDVFQIQDEIAASVVQGLHFALLGETQPKSVNTRSVTAYSTYLQARSLELRADTQADWEKVAEYARLTISTDVSFAQAWAYFAHVLSAQALLGYIPGNIGWEAARQAATRSLELDPSLPDGHAAMAGILAAYDRNWESAQTQVEDALQEDAGNASAMYWAGFIAQAMGQTDRALAYFENAVTADPLNPDRYNALARVLTLKGRSDEAQVLLQKALLLDAGETYAHWNLARIGLASGDPEAALVELGHEPDEEIRLTGTAIALFALGRKADSDIPLTVLEQRYSKSNPADIAMVHAFRGERDLAFTWLDRAYQDHDPGCGLLKSEPLFENIRADARYANFLQRLHLPA
jgi:TolB-like protein/DNA-binding winged helix-turn-helix (wHTH) protein/lipoprotein NlpI